MPASAIRLHGFRELDRAFGKADKTLRKELRDAYKDAAEPVVRDAQSFALRDIDNLSKKRGVDWSEMRARATQRAVWVAPVARGVKSRGRQNLRRPNLAPLLLDSMEEALDQNVDEVLGRFEDLLDTVGRAWETA
jgi:hypothetical protein